MTASLEQAHALILQAKREETADGNPLTASRCYTTAIEYIMEAAMERARNISDTNQRRFFLFQVRGRVELYYERASLLLRTASEMGMLDKPLNNANAAPQCYSNGNSGNNAYAPDLPKAQYNMGTNSGGSNAVVGIPLQCPPANNNNNNNNQGKEEGGNYYYLSADPATAGKDAPPPPPPFSSDDLDALFKS